MISHKAREVSPFIVMEVLEKAEQMQQAGIDVIHLEVGEPDFDIPQCVKAASINALNQGHTHYTHSLGDPELREAICDDYLKKYGVTISPSQILITSGSSPAILLVLSALLNEDDEVIYSDPGYACYSNFIRYTGGTPVAVQVGENNGFQYEPSAICKKITPRTKAIMINSPMNPTGNLLSPKVMKEIARLSPYIISDEIYHGLVYEGRPHSILEYTNKAFVLNGFSKTYAMTGLRLGYVIAPKEFVRPMQKLQQNLFICAGSVSQRSGIAALKEADADVVKMKNIYNERRLYMIKRLKEMGFSIPVEPTGAFYVFVNTQHLSNNSYKLAFDILEKAHVGVTPGIDFGEFGEGYIRFSYANSIENIKEGLDRLEKYLERGEF